MANSQAPDDAKQNEQRIKQSQSFDSKVFDLASLNKQYSRVIGEYSKFLSLKEQLAEKSRIKILQAELKDEETTAERNKELAREIAEETKRIEAKALEATLAYKTNQYKRASVREKALLAKENADKLKAFRDEKVAELRVQMAMTDTTAEEAAKLADKIREINEETNKQLQSDIYGAFNKTLDNVENKLSGDKLDRISLGVALFGANEDAKKKLLGELDDALEDAEKRVNEAELNLELAIKKNDNTPESLAAISRAKGDVDSAKAEQAKLEQTKKLVKSMEKASKAIASMSAIFGAGIKDAEDFLISSKSLVESRLQGSGKTFDKISDLIESQTAMSPYMKTQDVLNNMKTLAEGGIAYNIEQRAFLMTISDKIAATFDAFDSNLTRLIRLQQADTTAARLGMEASLTKFLNNMFQDSSYLNSLSDSVAAAIIDANASMSRNASAEFEYIVQKWLGALSSLGMSENTITSIAEGINYIATGDVQSLSSSTSLQTLFAMSASNAGLSYSDLLLNGLNASNTNKLLESMVVYLKDIAENSDNQVVRSAYGGIFNMSLSDLKAISNLTSGDISNIASNSLSYSKLQGETSSQLSNIHNRLALSEMLNNIYENAIYGVGEDMLSSPVSYSMYKMLDFMERMNLDIALPFVNAFGTGLDLNTSVQDLLNLGLGVSSAFHLIPQILQGISNLVPPTLNGWNATEYTQRGSGLVFSTGSVAGGTTGGTYVGSGNSTDMKNSAISTASDDAEETSKITNKNQQDAYNIDDLYKAVIEGNEPYIRSEDRTLSKVFDDNSHYLHMKDSRFRFVDEKLKVYDSSLNSSLLSTNGYLETIKSKITDITPDVDSIRSKITGVSDTTGGFIRVKEQSPITSSLFSSALAAQTLKVKAEDSSGVLVHIVNASDIKADSNTTVSLSEGTTVSISADDIAKGVRDALGIDASNANVSTIFQILNALYNDGNGIKVNSDTAINTKIASISPFLNM